MLENLTQRLSRVMKTMRGEARMTEANIGDALREVRMALLEADVALPVVKDFVAQVKEKALGTDVVGSLTPGQAFVGVVHEQLKQLMGEAQVPLALNQQPPAIILMAGLQGAGKTTTVGKLARWLKQQQKKKVMVVSCDVYRPAAIDQLKHVAEQVGATFFPSTPDQKPADIAAAAVDWARKHHEEILIVDTAGRLAIDQAMMDEIKALHAQLDPVETLFVVDAMLGQDAVNTAKAFNETLPLTGVVLTKLDGDARGGAALSVRAVTGKPIKFIGVAEKLDGLEPFYPDRMASRILGMGDILSLVEAASQQVDMDQAAAMAQKIKSGKGFDLNDFRAQVAQMRQMGGMSAMMDKLPSQFAEAAAKMPAGSDDKMSRQIQGIIDSMTPGERSNPELIKASRKRRIATGAGVQVQDVNRILNQFEQTQKMMKQFGNMFKGKGGMMKMMRGAKSMFGGKLPF